MNGACADGSADAGPTGSSDNACGARAAPSTSAVARCQAPASGLFAGAAPSPLDVPSPATVTTGDFNADGNLDLAVVNFDPHSVSVWLGDGSGAFTTSRDNMFAVENPPRSLATGDFNRDGKLDLALPDGATVRVMLGNGSGGFAEAPDSPIKANVPGATVGVGAGPWAVIARDFNCDGELDLAVVNQSEGTVSVLLGNGRGGFANAPRSPVPVGSEPWSIRSDDFNDDGIPDLAVVNYGDATLSVLLGDGRGRFSDAMGSPLHLASYQAPEGMTVGDFNGDGFVDLAVVENEGSTVSILLGYGTGRFSEAPGSPFFVGPGPVTVASGDLDGDGHLDLIVVNEGATASGSSVSALLGHGDGSFSDAPGSPIAVSSCNCATDAVLGDFNHDQKLDMAVAVWGANQADVMLNRCQ